MSMVNGLFVGDHGTTQDAYIRKLELPSDASMGDVAREQSRRYFADQSQQRSIPADQLRSDG